MDKLPVYLHEAKSKLLTNTEEYISWWTEQTTGQDIQVMIPPETEFPMLVFWFRPEHLEGKLVYFFRQLGLN